MELNPVGLNGMDFIEYCGPKAKELQALFIRLGMKEVAQHKSKKIKLFKQGDIHFFLNEELSGFAADFGKSHGPSICSTGFRVENSDKAFKVAVERGGRPYTKENEKSFGAPTIYGIGDSLIYFIDSASVDKIYKTEFNYTPKSTEPKGKGLYLIDHLTNNVPVGEMQKWCDFYEKVFNFKERRYFDIKGAQTGLISKVMRSPCGKITIPINEPTDQKSQIQEYLNEYHGSGIQHVALATEDICSSVAQLRKDDIPVLDIPDTYYEMIPSRLPQVTEDIEELKRLQILVDGDPEGYLLQL
ncbi:4-hydroxyphenylpyruvate dioxygenase, partial [bacterium]|nr:4-hydroxyphenylpyruvate dioxygenase [bacterium]